MARFNKKYALLALLPICSLALVLDLPTSQAEFELNFQSHSGSGDLGDGGRGGRSYSGAGGQGGGGVALVDGDFEVVDVAE